MIVVNSPTDKERKMGMKGKVLYRKFYTRMHGLKSLLAVCCMFAGGLCRAQTYGDKLLEDRLPFTNALALAKQGDARGYYQLAILFSDGDGVERNRATGYRFLEKAADMGYGNAWYVMGRIKAARVRRVIDFWRMYSPSDNLRAPSTFGLTGAVLWDGLDQDTPPLDEEVFRVASNCYAKAVAAGVKAAEKDLRTLCENHFDDKADEQEDLQRSKDRKVNGRSAKAAFGDLMVEEYDGTRAWGKSLPDKRDMNAEFDVRSRRERRTAKFVERSRARNSSTEIYSPPRSALPDDLVKSNANVRIDSFCGIRFGEKRPEWIKSRPRQSKLPKPFRFFTEAYVVETESKLVQAIQLTGKMRPDATAEERKDEQQTTLAILEKRYGFRFPRNTAGKVDTHMLYNKTFGRYNIHLFDGDYGGTPTLHLSITDMEIVKEEARKNIRQKTLPKEAGLDVL